MDLVSHTASVVTSTEKLSIAPDGISTRCPSPRPSVSKEAITTTHHPATGPADRGSPSCDTRIIPETNPKIMRSRELIQLTALCWFIYLEGWNDGTNGPLLPRMQRVYGVSYAVASLIFVFASLGFITGALANVVLTAKSGFGKVMVMGSLFQVVVYAIECTAPPFPVFLLAYFINGIGVALQNAQSVGYVASFRENTETKMGIFMAAYGGGALSSPLVATQFAQLNHWSFHYLTSLGIALINTATLLAVFRLKTQEGICVPDILIEKPHSLQECLAQTGIPPEPKQTSERSHFRQIMALKEVHLLACFALFYIGAEVAMGGWIVTYVIDVRGGGTTSGYISTGFFGGMMVGRIALLWVNKKIGERLALFAYAMCTIGLELVIWFVPSLVGDAVAVATVGVLMGPMYPIAMNHCGRIFPRWILTGAIGWVAGSGQAGSALVPFIAGAIASKAGIAVLQPVMIGILGFMTVIWALVPKGPRRHD